MHMFTYTCMSIEKFTAKVTEENGAKCFVWFYFHASRQVQALSAILNT